MDQPISQPVKPYDLIGGGAVIEAIVSRFYELMDTDPAYADLRALHAEDLGPIRDGLTQFLTAWTGGPSDWFGQGKCVMSLHRQFPITAAIGEQWADAMARAIAEQSDMEAHLSQAMQIRLTQMARAMVNQQNDADAA